MPKNRKYHLLHYNVIDEEKYNFAFKNTTITKHKHKKTKTISSHTENDLKLTTNALKMTSNDHKTTSNATDKPVSKERKTKKTI